MIDFAGICDGELAMNYYKKLLHEIITRNYCMKLLRKIIIEYYHRKLL